MSSTIPPLLHDTRTRFSTVVEVARVLRVSKMTIYRLIKAGTLPAYEFGRTVRIPTSAVWDYIHGAEIKPGNLAKARPL